MLTIITCGDLTFPISSRRLFVYRDSKKISAVMSLFEAKLLDESHTKVYLSCKMPRHRRVGSQLFDVSKSLKKIDSIVLS